MPDSQGKPLPPLPDEAFDGERQKTELVFTKCPHNSLKLVSAMDVQCQKCGCGWSGPQAHLLYESWLKSK